MKRYLVLLKSTIMQIATYRASLIFDVVNNVFIIFLLYYFWKAVYYQADQIHAMTFHQTFVYIIFASLIMTSLDNGVEIRIAGRIFSGDIAYDLARPLNYQLRVFFETSGAVVLRLLYYTLPVLTVFLILFNTQIPFGINIPFFFVALAFSYLINFLVSFTVGLLGFYLQSGWGVSVFKNVTVSLFSGALIPLNFFPGVLKKIAFFLPFHTIINTPMMLITAKDLSISVAFTYLIQQSLWTVVLLVISVFLFKRLINTLIVNGG